MSTTNGEKDSLLGQTVLPPELGQILGGLVFLGPPFNSVMCAFQHIRTTTVNETPSTPHLLCYARVSSVTNCLTSVIIFIIVSLTVNELQRL